MGNPVQIDSALLQNMVSFIGAAGKQLDKVAKDQEQAKEAAPAVVDALVKQGLLKEDRKATAIAALSESHVRALDTLKKTASHVKKEVALPSMGEAADALKKAAADEASPVAKADANFMAALGF